MQIGDWGNVLIHHVREWKHRKYSPWACPFSGVEFRGTFHFQKIIFLQLLQIWSILFPLWYWPIMNAHTKRQQDKVFQMDFIDSQKSNPPFAHLLALSHYMCIHRHFIRGRVWGIFLFQVGGVKKAFRSEICIFAYYVTRQDDHKKYCHWKMGTLCRLTFSLRCIGLPC